MDRDHKEYILFCELQSTGLVLLKSGLLVGLTFVVSFLAMGFIFYLFIF